MVLGGVAADEHGAAFEVELAGAGGRGGAAAARFLCRGWVGGDFFQDFFDGAELRIGGGEADIEFSLFDKFQFEFDFAEPAGGALGGGAGAFVTLEVGPGILDGGQAGVESDDDGVEFDLGGARGDFGLVSEEEFAGFPDEAGLAALIGGAAQGDDSGLGALTTAGYAPPEGTAEVGIDDEGGSARAGDEFRDGGGDGRPALAVGVVSELVGGVGGGEPVDEGDPGFGGTGFDRGEYGLESGEGRMPVDDRRRRGWREEDRRDAGIRGRAGG